jgi:hypothetical protein
MGDSRGWTRAGSRGSCRCGLLVAGSLPDHRRHDRRDGRVGPALSAGRVCVLEVVGYLAEQVAVADGLVTDPLTDHRCEGASMSSASVHDTRRARAARWKPQTGSPRAAVKVVYRARAASSPGSRLSDTVGPFGSSRIPGIGRGTGSLFAQRPVRPDGGARGIWRTRQRATVGHDGKRPEVFVLVKRRVAGIRAGQRKTVISCPASNWPGMSRASVERAASNWPGPAGAWLR